MERRGRQERDELAAQMEQSKKQNANCTEGFRVVREFCEANWKVVFADSLFDLVRDPKTTGHATSKA